MRKLNILPIVALGIIAALVFRSNAQTPIRPAAGSVATVIQHENLILGSECGDASSGTFEEYDDSGQLLRTGNLQLALSNQSATHLSNGTVFVSGGNGDNCAGSSQTWEILNSSGQVLSSGNLADTRNSSASTLLNNGNVFLAGGESSPTAYDSSWEIHNGTTGALVSSGNLFDTRYGGHTLTHF